jgi:opacity protein-like surface antigen
MIGGGASVPVGDLSNFYDAGYNVQGALLINFGGLPIKLRTDVNYSRLKLKDFLGTTPSNYSDDAATLLGGMANLSLSLGVGPVRPYLLAGVGAFNVKPADTGTSAAESSIEFAINGGAGLQIRLFGIDAFLESRLNNVYTDKGIIDTKGIQMIPITFGVIF